MKKALGYVLGVGLLVTMTLGSLQAQTFIHVRETVSGTTQQSQINPSGEEGRTSALGICEGSGNNYAPRGYKDFPTSETNQFTCRSITQVAEMPKPELEYCPAGTAMEFEVTSFFHIQRYNDREGSLLFSKMDPSGPNYVCATPGTGGPRIVFTTYYDGGTGRFKGASGTASWEFFNKVILKDQPGPGGNNLFAGSWGKTEGILILP